MRLRLNSYEFVLFFVLILLFTMSGIGFAEESLYVVEDKPISWILDGLPSDSDHMEIRTIQLARSVESSVALDFELSDLIDEQGNIFPREMVMIQTPYDSAWETWDSPFSQKRMLTSADHSAETTIGVKYSTPIRAGNYTGWLYSKHGDDIPLQITVPPYTEITVYPQEVSIDLNGGPGLYKAEESVTVEIRANHGAWNVNLSSAGLFYQDDQKDDWKEFIESIQLFIEIEQDKPLVSLKDNVLIRGAEYGSSPTISFRVHARSGWEHPAGNYQGTIDVYLSE